MEPYEPFRWVNTEPSVQFKKANTDPSVQFRKANTDPSISQLQNLFCQNRECIENFSRQFFGSRIEKRKNRKQKQIESVLRKNSAKRYL